ncbi:MAG: hypothetical protein GX606_05880 [Elusimicrobia bacterium]|nr:hypothetical protein [Elusimicrobiota bacterium]
MEQQFGLADLLAGLTDFGKQIPATAKEELKCPTCGLTYDEFRKLGRFGCAQCYVAFHSQLRTLLKKIHGSNSHLGKHPEHVSPLVIDEVPSSGAVTDPGEEALDHLRLRLQKAIMEEDFEQAAVLRDKIRKIEQGE